MCVILPDASFSIVRTKALPRSMKVTSCPSLMTRASSASMSMFGLTTVALTPAPSNFLCLGTVLTSNCGAPAMVTFTQVSPSTAVWRGQTGSMMRLLMCHSFSHSIRLTFLLAPCSRMNSRSPCTVRPRRTMPCTVGKRGSYQPSTCLLSTNHCSLRLDMSVYIMFSREKSHISTLRTPCASSIQLYSALRSWYSDERSACVTPSRLSTSGQAQS
mmetsp:Transcript_12407/g.38292  ORF Transcript_12407/g.38292 Transcript_12407/m.38292 type:complete len:215 (+) Transcript_12407:407-1051(+)